MDQPAGGCLLGVEGELDVETGPQLTSHLHELKGSATHLRLDLSGITFIDCTGLAAVLGALREARDEGWALEVDERVSRPVHRMVEISGVESLMWP